MNKKYVPYLVILLLAIVLFFVKRCQRNDPASPKNVTDNRSTDRNDGVDRNRGFDRRVSFIEYTQHAKCRMQCRQITQEEVKEIMQNGKINYAKSDVKARPCPEYALEGVTQDNQRVRIIFAQCDTKTKVVTCIDLQKEWSCDCPGDDKDHGNKKGN